MEKLVNVITKSYIPEREREITFVYFVLESLIVIVIIHHHRELHRRTRGIFVGLPTYTTLHCLPKENILVGSFTIYVGICISGPLVRLWGGENSS